MTFICPQCGATIRTNETCEERFGFSQLKEVEQPAYYAVHHLSVPCYILQHNAYSRQGWLEARKLLSKFIDEEWTPAMARRQIRGNADSSHRKWSFTRGAKLPGVEQIVWRNTIAEVRLATADDYCSDVRRWAESILSDTEQLAREMEESA